LAIVFSVALPPISWAYLAGFTDGDGCITTYWSKNRSYLNVRVKWTQKESDSVVLDAISIFLVENGIKVTERQVSVYQGGHKFPQRELCISNNSDVAAVLRGILPYLVLKADKARETLQGLDEIEDLKKRFGRKYRVNARKAGLDV
jgi:intein/homing endonuclease